MKALSEAELHRRRCSRTIPTAEDIQDEIGNLKEYIAEAIDQ